MSAQSFGKQIGSFRIQPETEFRHRRVEAIVNRERRRNAGLFIVAFPDDVQDDIFESRIAIVSVRPPAARMQVHFHVARHRRIVAELQHRAAKIGSAFAIGKPRMKHRDASAVQGFESLSKQTLMQPDGLEQTFGRRIGDFVQQRDNAVVPSPLRVEAVICREHLLLLLPTTFCNVKRSVRCDAAQRASDERLFAQALRAIFGRPSGTEASGVEAVGIFERIQRWY